MNAKELGAQPAMVSLVTRHAFADRYEGQSIEGGLTKRELFAAMAMQAIVTWAPNADSGDIAERSVFHADALLAELAKDQS